MIIYPTKHPLMVQSPQEARNHLVEATRAAVEGAIRAAFPVVVGAVLESARAASSEPAPESRHLQMIEYLAATGHSIVAECSSEGEVGYWLRDTLQMKRQANSYANPVSAIEACMTGKDLVK